MINWQAGDYNLIIIPDNCEITVPSEFYKLVDVGMNGFTMKSDGGHQATFIWKRLVQLHDITNNLQQPFKDKKIIIKSCLSEIDNTFYKATLHLDRITGTDMAERIEKPEITELEWIEDKGERRIKIGENCRIFLPLEFNNLKAKGVWGFEMSHYRSPINSVKFFWEVPTFVINTFMSKREGFLITPTEQYRRYKMAKRRNKRIDINVSLEYDPLESNTFTKIRRLITFEPEKK